MVGTAERGAYFWTDVLRFLAASVVVIEHTRDLLFLTAGEVGPLGLAWKAFYFVTGLGHSAVMVFFVLSGFWITAAVERRIDGPGFWPQYLIDRLSRLLMVIAPALVLGAMFDWLSIAVTHSVYATGLSGAVTMTRPVAETLTWPIGLGNLAFLQTIFVSRLGSNGPLWSVAYEFWYYIWFPALLLVIKRRRLSLGLATLGLAAFNPGLAWGFAVWLMGSALFYLDRAAQRRGLADWHGARAAVAAVLAAGAVGAALVAARVQLPVLGDDLVVGLAAAFALWVLLRINPRPLRLVRPVAAYGANASFSLYALHFPFVALVVSMVPPMHRAAPDAARLGAFGLVLALVWGFAWLFSRLTEMHTAAVRDRLRALLPAPRPASAGS